MTKKSTPIKSFVADYPEATPIMLYRGKEKIVKAGITCWPVDIFLLQLLPNSFPI